MHQNQTGKQITQKCLDRFKKLQLLLCANLLQWLNYGFTTLQLNRKSSRSSVWNPITLLKEIIADAVKIVVTISGDTYKLFSVL